MSLPPPFVPPPALPPPLLGIPPPLIVPDPYGPPEFLAGPGAPGDDYYQYEPTQDSQWAPTVMNSFNLDNLTGNPLIVGLLFLLVRTGVAAHRWVSLLRWALSICRVKGGGKVAMEHRPSLEWTTLGKLSFSGTHSQARVIDHCRINFIRLDHEDAGVAAGRLKRTGRRTRTKKATRNAKSAATGTAIENENGKEVTETNGAIEGNEEPADGIGNETATETETGIEIAIVGGDTATAKAAVAVAVGARNTNVPNDRSVNEAKAKVHPIKRGSKQDAFVALARQVSVTPFTHLLTCFACSFRPSNRNMYVSTSSIVIFRFRPLIQFAVEKFVDVELRLSEL